MKELLQITQEAFEDQFEPVSREEVAQYDLAVEEAEEHAQNMDSIFIKRMDEVLGFYVGVDIDGDELLNILLAFHADEGLLKDVKNSIHAWNKYNKLVSPY